MKEIEKKKSLNVIRAISKKLKIKIPQPKTEIVQEKYIIFLPKPINLSEFKSQLYQQNQQIKEDEQQKQNDEVQKFKNYSRKITFNTLQFSFAQNSYQSVISKQSILTLEPFQYLNDEVINFYLKFLQLEVQNNPKIFIFNTFFFNRLQQQDYPYKWTKNAQIFEKELVIIPYHNQNKNHWSLFALIGLDQFLQQNAQSLQIIYFDSLAIKEDHNEEIIKKFLLIFRFLTKELEKYESFNPIKLNFFQKKMNLVQPVVQAQNNLYDCGIYLLFYTESLIFNYKEIQQKLIKQEINLLYLFTFMDPIQKRYQILDLLYQINQKADYSKITQNYFIKNQQKIFNNFYNQELELLTFYRKQLPVNNQKQVHCYLEQIQKKYFFNFGYDRFTNN